VSEAEAVAKQKKSLAESLVEDGIITQGQLEKALLEEKRSGERLRNVLVKMGLIAEEDLVSFLSQKLEVPRIELNNYLIDTKVIELVPEELARKHELIPVLKVGNRLVCAMADPGNIFALDELKYRTNLLIEPAVATQTEIKKALGEHYGVKGDIAELLKSIDEEKLGLQDGREIDGKQLEDIVKEPVVIKLVNLILLKAIQEGASDIHLEPEEELLGLRFRVDGMLHEEPSPPKHLQSAVISRIKIMANLDIAERRAPQDGRFNIKMEGREIDVRVSCVPTLYGENVVLRLLDVSYALLGLEQLGFSRQTQDKYEKLILRAHGIILVSGPTGSGKTTTLYSSLAKINTPEKNIITIEDPVEYKLAGIRQIPVNPKVELGFAQGLRSILRQDPNVIMVGEIRDRETAEIAIQAALTGHLVFSTLHTNDAAGAVSRLIDMGIDAYLIASSLVAVLAQRLVRVICKDCKEEYAPSPETLADLGLTEKTEDRGQKTEDRRQKAEIKFYRGKGCARCRQSGYKGRISIFELLIVDGEIRDLITAKASLAEIRREARSAGMLTLKDDGINKVKAGITTPEEVLRVTQEE
jgi:type IV pilus assembly protein PilB